VGELKVFNKLTRQLRLARLAEISHVGSFLFEEKQIEQILTMGDFRARGEIQKLLPSDPLFEGNTHASCCQQH